MALLAEDHSAHQRVRAACRGLTLGLAGHAMFETCSVLTRLPGGNRLSPDAASRIIAREFPLSVVLPADQALRAPGMFAEAGIAGGAVYDALVGMAARAAGIPLLSCDRRAAATYAALTVPVEVI